MERLRWEGKRFVRQARQAVMEELAVREAEDLPPGGQQGSGHHSHPSVPYVPLQLQILLFYAVCEISWVGLDY